MRQNLVRSKKGLWSRGLRRHSAQLIRGVRHIGGEVMGPTLCGPRPSQSFRHIYPYSAFQARKKLTDVEIRGNSFVYLKPFEY